MTSFSVDRQSDERDTAYAQQYLDKVRDTFADDDKYREFLLTMHNFGKDRNAPGQIIHVRFIMRSDRSYMYEHTVQ